MRLALSSSAFDRALAAGDLTQLEFLDRCAGELGADGVILDITHFPRRDPEYLAQIKKFAADLALSLVAVRDDGLPSVAGSGALAIAEALGAPYVLVRMPAGGIDPVTVYNGALAVLSAALIEAKRRNVTLAVRNVRGTLAGDGFALNRLRKEADSAWLRFALDVPELPDALDERTRKRVVLAYRSLEAVAPDGRDPAGAAIVDGLRGFRGFLCLDYAGPEGEDAAVKRLLAGWRRALAQEELGVAEPRVPS